MDTIAAIDHVDPRIPRNSVPEPSPLANVQVALRPTLTIGSAPNEVANAPPGVLPESNDAYGATVDQRAGVMAEDTSSTLSPVKSGSMKEV